MRRAVLTLAALAIVGLAADTALAQHRCGYGGSRGRASYGRYNVSSRYVPSRRNVPGRYNTPSRYASSHHGYYGNRYSYGSRTSSYGSSFFLDQYRRIQGNMARNPRSVYTSGPRPYGYRGW